MVDERVLPDTLVIPVKRWRVMGRATWSVGIFALCGVGGLYGLIENFDDVHIAWIIVAGLINLLFIVGVAIMAYHELKTVRVRCMRLDHNGFEFGADRWVWKDISRIHESVEWDGEDRIVRIGVVCPRIPTPRVPPHAPINPLDFRTGGQPLVDILNEWLDRARGQDQNSVN